MFSAPPSLSSHGDAYLVDRKADDIRKALKYTVKELHYDVGYARKSTLRSGEKRNSARRSRCSNTCAEEVRYVLVQKYSRYAWHAAETP